MFGRTATEMLRKEHTLVFGGDSSDGLSSGPLPSTSFLPVSRTHSAASMSVHALGPAAWPDAVSGATVT